MNPPRLLDAFKKSRLHRYTAGQMLAIFALTWVIFAGGMFSVYNVGTLVGERMRLQNAADSAAFTGAVWEARCLNYIAYTNRTIIAELSFICFLCALTSCVDAWKKLCGYAKYIYLVGYIFAAIEAVLSVIETMLETLLELPWELLPQGVGLLQSTMETFLSAKITDAMKEAGKSYDPSIQINSGIHAAAEVINRANHFGMFDPDNGAIRKKGKWEGLLKVLNETICNYTRGTFDGIIPIYNRSFSFSLKIPYVIKVSLGVTGDVEISKEKVKTSDGPGVSIYFWDWDDWEWDLSESATWGLSTKEKTLNLDQIRHYVFDQKDNMAVGIYAVAQKSSEDMSPMLFQKFNGLFGVPKKDLTAIAKACARYDDPDPSSTRHTKLKGSDSDDELGADDSEASSDDWEPNLFNPFWKAELVALKAKNSEDFSSATSFSTVILPAMEDSTLLSNH